MGHCAIFGYLSHAPQIRVCNLKIVFLISQPKHMFFGTQKNRLDETVETVLLSTQDMFKLIDKKIIEILHKFFSFLNWPYAYLHRQVTNTQVSLCI